MTITPQNLVRHELIGLKVKIAKSTDSTHKFSGIVVDETYNTFKIETKGKEKVIPKKNSIFIFTLPNGMRVEVEGKILISRPEDRIKKKIAKW
jgi:ribonuclease P protein subunit POP4